jgi:hypothetical protein
MQLDAPVLWLVMQGSACMYVYIKSRSIYWLYSCKSSSTDAEGAARCSAMRSLADCLDASSSCDLRARVTGAHFTCFTGTKVQVQTHRVRATFARESQMLTLLALLVQYSTCTDVEGAAGTLSPLAVPSLAPVFLPRYSVYSRY